MAPISECPRCHNVNEPGSAFCYSCGLPFDEGRTPASAIFPAMRPAGFWVRLTASIIDAIVLIVAELVIIAAWPGISLSDYFSAGNPAWTGLDWTILVGNVLYYTLGVSIWATTIGKRIMGIYVLRPDASKVGLGRAFARYLAYIPSALLLFAGYLMVAFRGDKRALHDLMCGTVVVFRR